MLVTLPKTPHDSFPADPVEVSTDRIEELPIPDHANYAATYIVLQAIVMFEGRSVLLSSKEFGHRLYHCGEEPPEKTVSLGRLTPVERPAGFPRKIYRWLDNQ